MIAGLFVILSIVVSFVILEECAGDGSNEDGEFEQTDDKGVKWKFEVISEGERTVKISGINDIKVDEINIPEVVSDGEKEYSVVEIKAGLSCSGEQSVIKRITVPDSVISIGDYAFSNNVFHDLREVCFGKESKLKAIGNGAFSDAGMVNESKEFLDDAKDSGSGLVIDNKIGRNPTYYVSSDEFELTLSSDAGYTIGWQRGSSLRLAKITNANAECVGTDLDKNNYLIINESEKSYKDNIYTIKVINFIKGSSLEIYYKDPSSNAKKEIKIIREESSFASKLTISLPDSMRSMGKNAFTHASFVELNEGLDYIGSGALTGVSSIIIPSSVTQIGCGAFSNDVEITFTAGGILEGCYDADRRDFYSGPDHKELRWTLSQDDHYEFGLDVTHVGTEAFSGNERVKSVVIPSGMSWGVAPFNGSAVEEVIFDEGIASIPDYLMFKSRLKSISIPASIVSIGKMAFSQIDSMTSMSIENGSALTEIREYAFANCRSLGTVNLGSSAEGFGIKIGEGAFFKCDSLSDIVLDKNARIVEIGDAAFAKTIIGTPVKPQLQNKSPNFGTTTDGPGIHIPGTVTYVGEYVFSALGNATGSAESEYSAGILRDNKLVMPLNSGDGVVIGFNGAGAGIPSNLVSIGDYAFNLQATNIDLSKCASLESIGSNAFYRYDRMELPSEGRLRTVLGITGFSGAENGSYPEVIPATVEEFVLITKAKSISFADGSRLRQISGEGGAGLSLDLSNCNELESVEIIGKSTDGANPSVTMAPGVYGIEVSGFKVTNSSNVIYEGGSAVIRDSTTTINKNLIGKVQFSGESNSSSKFYLESESGGILHNSGRGIILIGLSDPGKSEVRIGAESKITEIADRAFSGTAIETLWIEKVGLKVGSMVLSGCNLIDSVYILAKDLDLAEDAFLIEDESVIQEMGIISGGVQISSSKLDIEIGEPGSLMGYLKSGRGEVQEGIDLVVSSFGQQDTLEVKVNSSSQNYTVTIVFGPKDGAILLNGASSLKGAIIDRAFIERIGDTVGNFYVTDSTFKLKIENDVGFGHMGDSSQNIHLLSVTQKGKGSGANEVEYADVGKGMISVDPITRTGTITVNGLYLGDHTFGFSGSSDQHELGRFLEMTLGADEGNVKFTVEVKPGAHYSIFNKLALSVRTAKSVDFYVVPEYSDLSTSLSRSNFYLSYDVGDHRLFVPSMVDGVSVNVGEIKSGSNEISMEFSDGFAIPDMEFAVDQGTAVPSGSSIRVSAGADAILKISKKDRTNGEMATVVFYANGGTVDGSDSFSVTIPSGCTLIDADIPVAVFPKHVFDGWRLDGTSVYDFDSIVNRYTVLVAAWSSGNPTITISTDAADIIYDGRAVETIAVVDGMGDITLSYDAYDGYEILAWTVETGGTVQSMPISSDGTLTISAPDGDVTVSLSYRYYSSSAGLIPVVNRDLPTNSELSSTIRAFDFGGVLNRSGSQWTGHDSVPLIVDGYMYVRQGNSIYKVESDTGYSVASVRSVSTSAYYHQLPYGNGVIYDYMTDTAYDLDLKPLFELDRSLGCVEYHDGYFYSCGSTLYRFAADAGAGGTISPVLVGTFDKQVYGSYGFTGSVFIGNFIYRTYTEGSDRGIAAMDLGNGKTSHVVLPGLKDMMLDDGWISEYKGTIYLTGYAVGLFGVKSTTADDAIGFVDADGLVFKNAGSYTFTGMTSFASQFVVANGFGFVKAGSLYVFDLRSTRVLSHANLLGVCSQFPGGHGSIVLDVTDADADNGWMTYIYSIPYYTDKVTMAVAEAHLETGSDGNDRFVFEMSTAAHMPQDYNSQAVRADLDGRMVWYNDSGHIFSYTVPEKNNYYFFISDGKNAEWYRSTGATASAALKALGNDVATLDALDALKTVWGKDADGWRISVLHSESIAKYEWRELRNLYDAVYNTDHYYAITFGAVPGAGTEFKYLSDGEMRTYAFADNIGDRGLIGSRLVRASEEMAEIRFFEDIDGTSKPLGGTLIGAVGTPVNGSFPSVIRTGYTGTWVDSDGAVVNSLPAIFEKSTSYTLKWTGVSYSVDGSVTAEGSRLYADITISRTSGEADILLPNILVIAEYEGGRFINIYDSFFTSGGSAVSKRIGLSESGCVGFCVFVVNGMPAEGAYSNYGAYLYSVSG